MSPARAAGALLVAAAYAPLFRLLDPERGGPAASATLDAAASAWSGSLYGTLLVLGSAAVAGILAPPGLPERVGARLLAEAERLGQRAFMTLAGGLAFVLAAVIARTVHRGAPTSVDEMAQLLHAEALADGLLTVPTGGAAAAFAIQNGVVLDGGWASIYPPLHTGLLAVGSLLGAAWLVGPVAIAIGTAAAVPVFEATLGIALGRAAAAVLALTPFWLVLGATHLSHSTGAAALLLVTWAALRARDGALAPLLATGAAVGAAVTARPWVGLVCSLTIVTVLWGRGGAAGASVGRRLRRVAALGLGGAPFALGLFAWNVKLFGGPFTLGYSAAFGPAHGLGLHRDPWGNLYGLREAIAYTSADLVQLGGRLLESPLPGVALAGVGLTLAARSSSARLYGAWIGAALLANALYWHHGIHFGPRMLFESTPAWIALATVGAHSLSRQLRWGGWIVVSTAVVAAGLAPRYVVASSSGPSTDGLASAAERGPALVFAHGSWASRVAARLAADGMRRDSIETALRRNDLCAVDLYARWRASARAEGRGGAAPPLDFEARPGTPSDLEVRLLSEGVPVRIDPERAWDESCVRQARSDRFGIVELEPLLWRAPPLPGRSLLVVRDLGPVANASVLAARTGTALVLMAGPDGGRIVLDYEAGMELLWRGAAGAARAPGGTPAP